MADQRPVPAAGGTGATGRRDPRRPRSLSYRLTFRSARGLGYPRAFLVERTIALLHWFRRLRIRWEIRDDIHEAFMTLAAAIICWRRLVR